MKNGNIYFGTQDAGLLIYNKGKFINYNSSNGICSNFIQSVCIAKSGIWLGTDKGVNKLKLNDDLSIKELRYYGTEDGFLSAEINLNSFFNIFIVIFLNVNIIFLFLQKLSNISYNII